MKRHVWTVLAAFVLLGFALGCGGGERVVEPTKTFQADTKARPKGSAEPPAHPK